jgi:hypothetical protein
MEGFKDFVAAQITLAGVELLPRIRQRQFALRKLGVVKKTAPEISNAVLAASGGKPFKIDLGLQNLNFAPEPQISTLRQSHKSQLCNRASRCRLRNRSSVLHACSSSSVATEGPCNDDL